MLIVLAGVRINMKTNYKIIISGGILFVFGVYAMLNDSYRNYLFGIHPDLGVVGFLVSLSAGLVITGTDLCWNLLTENIGRKNEN
jgi:hypothetical protein